MKPHCGAIERRGEASALWHGKNALSTGAVNRCFGGEGTTLTVTWALDGRLAFAGEESGEWTMLALFLSPRLRAPRWLPCPRGPGPVFPTERPEHNGGFHCLIPAGPSIQRPAKQPSESSGHEASLICMPDLKKLLQWS